MRVLIFCLIDLLLSERFKNSSAVIVDLTIFPPVNMPFLGYIAILEVHFVCNHLINLFISNTINKKLGLKPELTFRSITI